MSRNRIQKKDVYSRELYFVETVIEKQHGTGSFVRGGYCTTPENAEAILTWADECDIKRAERRKRDMEKLNALE